MMATKIQGARVKAQDTAGNPVLTGAAPGSFGKNSKGEWYALHPISGLNLASKLMCNEPIVEHPDGNITTTAQIVAIDGLGASFVGTIQRGVWITAT
jgi:hypothetical protein